MRTPTPLIVVAVCFLVVVFDGYDLIVYGASVPDLLHEPGWHLTPSRVGGIASWTLFGMLLGALGAGLLADRLGPRRLILVGVCWFSLAMVACAVAPGPDALRALRFLAGLGPQLMRKAGYDLGTALTFLIVLNLGAIIGAISASVLADRFGAKRAAVGSFAVAVGSLLLLTHRMDQGRLFLAVGAAGFGSVGTQILVNGYLAAHYPVRLRGAALGWSLGVGRAGAILGPTLGGWLLDAGFGFRSNFYTFAGVAAGGLLAIAAVPPRRAEAPSDSVTLERPPAREEMLA